jgi:hypothetical protein
MKIIKNLKDALEFAGNQPATVNTLEYIFDHLHHNCYMLKDGEIIKFENSTSPPLRSE